MNLAHTMHTLGSPCAAKVVRRRSNGYEAIVAAAPAMAPLPKDTADERAWSGPNFERSGIITVQ